MQLRRQVPFHPPFSSYWSFWLTISLRFFLNLCILSFPILDQANRSYRQAGIYSSTPFSDLLLMISYCPSIYRCVYTKRTKCNYCLAFFWDVNVVNTRHTTLYSSWYIFSQFGWLQFGTELCYAIYSKLRLNHYKSQCSYIMVSQSTFIQLHWTIS